jgi:hypothetical protein
MQGGDGLKTLQRRWTEDKVTIITSLDRVDEWQHFTAVSEAAGITSKLRLQTLGPVGQKHACACMVG